MINDRSKKQKGQMENIIKRIQAVEERLDKIENNLKKNN